MRKDDQSKLTWFQVCRKPSQASLTLPSSMKWMKCLQRGQSATVETKSGTQYYGYFPLLSVELTHLLQKK